MFTKSADIYDAVYSSKDYEADASRLHELIQQRGLPDGSTLLDVACGTGRHISLLGEFYKCEGLDLDENMLAIAEERNPSIEFHQADMAGFDLGKQFDIVTCLFSAIGSVRTKPRLLEAIQAMARHTRPGGLVMVEPWLMPAVYKPDTLHALFVNQPDLKIARMNTSELKDGMSVFDFHYLVGTPEGVRYFTEHHELGLFAAEDYLEALRAASLQVEYDPAGLMMDRGLFVGLKQDMRSQKSEVRS